MGDAGVDDNANTGSGGVGMDGSEAPTEFTLGDAPLPRRKRRSDTLPPERVRNEQIVIRCTREYKEWFDLRRRAEGKTAPQFVSEAVEAKARQDGFPPPPPMGYLPLPRPGKPANVGLRTQAPRRRTPIPAG